MQNIFTLKPKAPKEAAADAPASPVPTTMTSNFLLLAGFTNFWSALYFVHFSASGPCGILEFSVVISF